ncbi:UNVERIFIED_CONTAM: hypothetical protein FKN15_073041 [Acipenser sinensis]
MPSFHNELTSIGLILMFVAVLPLLFLSGQTDWAELSIWTAMMYVLLCVFLVGALLLFLGFYLTVKSNHSNTSSPSLFFLQSRLQEPQRTIIQSQLLLLSAASDKFLTVRCSQNEYIVEHLRSIRINTSTFPVARHFNSNDHTIEDITICGMVQCYGANAVRKQKECELIFKPGTLEPFGMNIIF